MYICICNAITDSQFHEAANGETGSVAEIYARLGAKPQCGKCLAHANARLSHSEKQGPAVAGR